MTLHTQPNPEALADGVFAAIKADVEAGLLPVGAATFAELHDYTDANVYLEDVPESPGDDAYVLTRQVADIVDARIKAGDLARADR